MASHFPASYSYIGLLLRIFQFIPRENNLVRLYLQLSFSDLATLPDGRLDKAGLNPEEAKRLIMEVSRPSSLIDGLLDKKALIILL